MNMRLNKLIDEPNFNYKGVIYCEGITNLNLEVLPKRTPEDTQNAVAKFKKCIFVVENAATIDTLLKFRDK